MVASGNNPRSKWSKNIRLITLTTLCLTLAVGFLGITSAQQGRREIVSDDFTKPRPTPTPRHKTIVGKIMDLPTVMRTPTPTPPKLYRLAASSSPTTPPLTGNLEQLGVTLWRLRPARRVEIGQRLMVKEKGKSSEWIPERIELDTSLGKNDRVRLSIESPREGYLYVVARDLYADGKTSDAMLVFPTRSIRAGDNQVRPGKLIDLPGQEDNPNYYLARANRADQTGKVLTIIVTAKPLDLNIGNQPVRISAADMAIWEKAWGSESERFEMVGGAGQAWTSEEKEASAANGSQELTPDAPPPQTIYRLAATNKTAFLVNVRLSYLQ